MESYLLRRRKLGNTSCREISNLSEKGIKVFRNDAVLPKADVVFRWGCTTQVDAGTIVNSAAAIHKVNDKLGFRKQLMADAPDTIPITWFNPNDLNYPLREPVVVRKSPHHQGRNLHLCKDEAAVRAACRLYDQYYISQFVNKTEEYRVTFISGRVVWVAKKTPGNPEEVAWNVAKGGRFDNVRWDNWPLKAIETSHKVFALTGLDFGAVDVMVDAEGQAYVLEVNSAPSLTSPYRQKCMATGFDFILEHGKAIIPIERFRKYRDVIHPSLIKEAA